jgi:hypothetical protein
VIVGCYTLHLYCDADNDAHEYQEFPHEYTDEFGSKTRVKAREEGWILKRDYTAICPKCNKKLHPKISEESMCGPFRIDVFGTQEITKKRGRKQYTERQGFGYQLWNPCEDTAAREGRPGFGSFMFYGLGVTRRAALDALLQPGIEQVAIKTNQDKRIATLYRSEIDRYLGQSKFQFSN